MSREEEIKEALIKEFPFMSDRIYIQKSKRIFTKPITVCELESLFPFVREKLGFYRASHVVGTDEGDTLGLLYILCDSENNILMLRGSVPKSEPRINSASSLYPSIVLHERELKDLFGVEVIGLPDGPNYPLPDGWPKGSYPMRKDWDPDKFNKETMTYEKSPGGEKE